ncbi:hypothetical protein B0I72DRAFT_142661 [Yarrowia lipolytica]|uniref:YALI0F28545p n=2 Tax=Yarrowia lipolytica TaxID=4952 RepID=Q6C017_YARLI|nr:YALI0F28545p [Yarrowia lipolytica CLIB122]AOW07840.1 hypothetical protein YALI1_F36267g [Yarrowia lipolytica]KAB8280535.1 hypothetical protein BKA91DRAFT_141795 [Yarrowia lipolytica]KAE8168867.1 hypothetical protein BKA90DRAFT_143546 [Yarrowia lipolytica]KAJ8055117.1 hypothetical protein LXG23DRAFT_56662 [Yarrowia lipolytica]QNP99487.1 Hypothetical protein YALI2_E00803g [Yarrowia lipolytica]|eukprot:XP_505995.1 YALI0F28545p [Yarrowia lipolytica CLIB122]
MTPPDDPIANILAGVNKIKHKASTIINDKLGDAEEAQHQVGTWLLNRKKDIQSVLTPAKLEHFSPGPPPPPPSYYDKITGFVSAHKLAVGLVTISAVTASGYYMWNNRILPGGLFGNKKQPRRRAVRAANGARTEVVVLAGSFLEPIVRVVANDLDKRGFIVYVTTTSEAETALIEKENSADIRSLSVNTQKADVIKSTMKEFGTFLATPQVAFPNAKPHVLRLAGVVLVPDLYYPFGPIEQMHLESWNSVINSKLLAPLALLSQGLLTLVRQTASTPNPARLVIVTPNITAALSPAYSAPEAMVVSGINALATSLDRELAPHGIKTTHIRLGSFDVSHGHSQSKQLASAIHADLITWSEDMRAAYSNYGGTMAFLYGCRSTRGSSLKRLNFAIYDSLTVRRPKRVWHVGFGSRMYELVAAFLPECVLSWLMRSGAALRKRSFDKELNGM